MAKSIKQNLVEQHGTAMGALVYDALVAAGKARAEKAAATCAQIAELRVKKTTSERASADFLACAAVQVQAARDMYFEMASAFDRLRILAQSESSQWDAKISELTASLHAPPEFVTAGQWAVAEGYPELVEKKLPGDPVSLADMAAFHVGGWH